MTIVAKQYWLKNSGNNIRENFMKVNVKITQITCKMKQDIKFYV